MKKNQYEIMSIRNTIVRNSEDELKAQQLQTKNKLVSWNMGQKNSPRKHRKGMKEQTRDKIKNRSRSMNIYIIKILEGMQRQNKREELFEEIMTKISQIQKYSNLRLKGYTQQ